MLTKMKRRIQLSQLQSSLIGVRIYNMLRPQNTSIVRERAGGREGEGGKREREREREGGEGGLCKVCMMLIHKMLSQLYTNY